MEPIFVVGHKNPDNDSISSVVAYAAFKNALAKREHEAHPEADLVVYKPVCLGPLPAESEWVLAENGFEAPEIIKSVNPGQKIILVDHNETQQAVDGIEEAEIIEVVDHHRIGSFSTSKPIQFITMPWGCSATIITMLYRMYNVEITPELARVLLSAILTDTVILKSPTATETDEKVIKYLAEIGGVEYVDFAMKLFDCRAGEDTMDIETLVCADSKEFPVGEEMILIAQRETVSPKKVLAREEEMRNHLKSLVEKNNYKFALLLVTDIMEEGSYFMVEGETELVEKVFGVTGETEGGDWMPGVLSRKKQVAAPILGA